jgi:hypothetical protein
MDIKEEVRRRIAELTRFAYERGYRDGAQAALTEMEAIGAEDVVEQLRQDPSAMKAIPGKKVIAKKPAKAKPAKASKGNAPAKANGTERGKPKTQVIQDAIQGLLDAKGEARRDDVLAAAQAKNPAITKFDLGNGIRILVKNAKVRVSPDDSGVILPAA